MVSKAGRRLAVVGSKIGANATRLHDEVVLTLARLFRSSRVDAIVEPIQLFAEALGNGSSQTKGRT